MYSQFKSIYINPYGQFGCRQYSSAIEGLLGNTHWANWERLWDTGIEYLWKFTWMEAVIKWTCPCTWRLWLIVFGDGLRGHGCANLEATIQPVWTSNWSWLLYEHGDRNPASEVFYLAAMILWDWWCTWRANFKAVDQPVWTCSWRSLWSGFRNALGGQYLVNLEAEIKRIRRNTWSQK